MGRSYTHSPSSTSGFPTLFSVVSPDPLLASSVALDAFRLPKSGMEVVVLTWWGENPDG